jgi:hypothetical protein
MFLALVRWQQKHYMIIENELYTKFVNKRFWIQVYQPILF